jgi:lysozyme
MDPLNVVIDLSHHNGNVDLAQAKADGVLGVIHKATQGLAFVDPMYAVNRNKALEAELLWGAYHFGVGGDGAAQADHFLTVVDPGPNDLLILDLEANPSGPSMSLDEAKAFLSRVEGAVGRRPGLYSGHYIKELLGNNADSFLADCWLWHSQYGPTPHIHHTWPMWTMWQYTDGHVGPAPHAVVGIGPCDRNMFNGDAAALRRLWGFDG